LTLEGQNLVFREVAAIDAVVEPWDRISKTL